MKIEKISDNQIRCTLTKEDLASRKIRLSELAYGSDKAKELFRDMMMEASREYGFEADNSPLMIEAVPISAEAIILIITKVEDPEELDSRFSRFSQEDNPPEAAGSPASVSEAMSGIDDILNLISRLTQAKRAATDADRKKQDNVTDSSAAASSDTAPAEAQNTDANTTDQVFNLTRFFLFSSLEQIIEAAKQLDEHYDGPNTLFKNPTDLNYYLILRKADTDAEQFNRICNLLTEYGICVDYTEGLEELFIEHMQIITSGNALQTLRQL